MRSDISDLMFKVFWLGIGIALLFTDAGYLGSLIIGLYVGRFM